MKKLSCKNRKHFKKVIEAKKVNTLEQQTTKLLDSAYESMKEFKTGIRKREIVTLDRKASKKKKVSFSKESNHNLTEYIKPRYMTIRKQTGIYKRFSIH